MTCAADTPEARTVKHFPQKDLTVRLQYVIIKSKIINSLGWRNQTMNQQSKKRKNRRSIMPRSSIFSLVAIMMSLALTVATTFALAYRTITTSSSVIATGTFDVEFCLLNDGATELGDDENWSVIDHNTAIFNCNNWQQSCTVVEVLRVTNNGSIPLKWKAALIPSSVGEGTDEADLSAVIDVYYAMVEAVPEVTIDANTGVTTCDLSGWTHAGTLRELLDGKDWDDYVIQGEATSYVAVALKMQEDANADYLGLNASFAFKFLAVQAVATDDQWPSVEGETVPAPEGSTPAETTESTTEPADEPDEPTETTAAVTEPADEPVDDPTETTEAPETTAEPETTAAAAPPVEPAEFGEYNAADEEPNAALSDTRLGQSFAVTYNEDGSGMVTDSGTYQLMNGELRTFTDEPYALSVTPTECESFKLFVRSQGIRDMSDALRGGDGAYVAITYDETDGSYDMNIGFIYSDSSEGEVIEYKSRVRPFSAAMGDQIVIADDGVNVYVLVNQTLRAIVELSEESFTNANQSFVQSASVYEPGAHSSFIRQEENTAIAATCDAQCGIVTDTSVSFSEISLQPYSTVAETIAEQLAAIEAPADPQ